MTMEIRIENKDKARTCAVVVTDVDPRTAQKSEQPAVDIKPGESRSFYAHSSNTLVITEVQRLR